jgi:ABC-type glycerol-3-phosphate transport system substrate-binding protein
MVSANMKEVKHMKRFNIRLLPLLLLLSLTGCGSGQTSSALLGAYDNEIITTTAVDQSKTLITVRIENNVAQTVDLEQVLEQKFPDVDFVLIHDGSLSSEYNIRADLINGTECDLILSRRLNTIDDIAADYLLDLSEESFVNQYSISAVDSCLNSEGKVYYLPGPSDVYGIIYDKTMFEENGWELPHSYSAFVTLLDTIRQANLTATYTDDNGNVQQATVVPIQPTMMYPDMFQIFFNTYGFDETLRGGENYIWLVQYQNGNGSMVGHMEPAVEKFKSLFDDGILSLADWEMEPGTRSDMMYTYHTTAMIVESQNAMNYAKTFAEEAGDADVYHEVGMMPFWTSDEADSDYLYSIPSYFMAINKQSAEESKEKKALLLEIYEYLSSVEGQQMLINGSPQISNVEGVSMDESSFTDEIRDTVERGQIVHNFYYVVGENSKQIEKQLRSTTPDLIQGKMSVEEWLLAADQVRDDFLAGTLTQETVYGQVKTTLTRLESAYTMAEMYRQLTDADIGICLGGGYKYGTDGHFYQGDITDSSLSCVAPDKESSSDDNPMAGTIVTSTMTGAQIWDILNNATGPADCDPAMPYYVASGLTVRFDPWAEEGNRVLSCKTPDGNDLDMDKTYQVAYFYASLPDSSIKPESSLGQTWQESFLTWLDQQDGVIKAPSMTLELAYGEGE